MSWSVQITDARGKWVTPRRAEADAWKLAAKRLQETYGQCPLGFDKGYMSLSGTASALRRMGWQAGDVDMDAVSVQSVAEDIQKARDDFVSEYPEDAFHADIARLFFQTAAKFKRGARGGH